MKGNMQKFLSKSFSIYKETEENHKKWRHHVHRLTHWDWILL